MNAATIFKTLTTVTLSITLLITGGCNNMEAKERFRYFIKVPELAQFYSEITDYRTAKDIGIDRPEQCKSRQ
jgi:elongation factor P--beta-lysine ligase